MFRENETFCLVAIAYFPACFESLVQHGGCRGALVGVGVRAPALDSNEWVVACMDGRVCLTAGNAAAPGNRKVVCRSSVECA